MYLLKNDTGSQKEQTHPLQYLHNIKNIIANKTD